MEKAGSDMALPFFIESFNLKLLKMAFCTDRRLRSVNIRDEAGSLCDLWIIAFPAFKNTRGLQPDEWLRTIRRNMAFHNVSQYAGAHHARVEVIA